MTPIQLEWKWQNTEERITNYFVRSSLAFLLLLATIAVLAYILFPLWQSSAYPAWARLNLVQDRYWASLTLITGALLFYFVPGKTVNFYLIFILCLSWFIPVYLLDSLRISSIFPVLYILLNSFFIFQFKKHKTILLFLCSFLFVALNILLGLDVELNKKGKLFQYFSLIHFEMLFFYFIQTIYQEKSNFVFNLNPLQLYAPLPLPIESEFIKNSPLKKAYFIKGFLEIAQSFLIFNSLFLLFKADLLKQKPSLVVPYVVFLFFVIAVMKSLHGILWIFGFKTPSATHFILLAKSPLETWQRGSTFIAKFVFNIIYFPLWKAFRSQIIAVFGVLVFIFFHLFLLHDFFLKNIFILFFPTFQTFPTTTHQLYQQLIWLTVWLVWILVFMFTFQKITFLKKTPTGMWILVLLTHIGNLLVLPLSLYLTQKLI